MQTVETVKMISSWKENFMYLTASFFPFLNRSKFSAVLSSSPFSVPARGKKYILFITSYRQRISQAKYSGCMVSLLYFLNNEEFLNLWSRKSGLIAPDDTNNEDKLLIY